MTNYSLRGTKQSRSQDRFSLVHLQVAHPHTAARFWFFFSFSFPSPPHSEMIQAGTWQLYNRREWGGWDLGGAYKPARAETWHTHNGHKSRRHEKHHHRTHTLRNADTPDTDTGRYRTARFSPPGHAAIDAYGRLGWFYMTHKYCGGKGNNSPQLLRPTTYTALIDLYRIGVKLDMSEY